MKKLMFLLFFSVFYSNSSIAQVFVFQASKGFEISKFDDDPLNNVLLRIIPPDIEDRKVTNYESSRALPFVIRIFAGFDHLQFGGELRRGIHSFAYKIGEDKDRRFTESHKALYSGGFIRFGTSSLEKFGFFLRLGGGINRITKIIKLENDNSEYESTRLSGSLQLNGGAGFSIPINERFHINLEGDYSRNMRNRSDYAIPPVSKDPKFLNTTLGSLLGLAVVF